MTTINTEYIMPENQRLARMINDLGELIIRENTIIYQEIVMAKFINTKDIDKLSPVEEKKFLLELYHHMVDKLKEIKFDS
jgi:hypothetical protein